MRYNYRIGISILSLLLVSFFVKAQDTLRFSKTTFITESKSLEAYAGGVIELGPGVLLLVEGSLCLEGEKNNPVQIINQDDTRPGVGIQVQGQTEGANVKIRHVNFQGLIQPLRFDPFWQRNEVILSDLKIEGSTSGEPVIYLGDPYIDLRKGAAIDLKLKDVELINNRAGLVIEAYGTPNVDYDIDDILFRDNYFDGPEQAVLHLELFPEAEETEAIGNLVFDRNRFEYDPLYLSLSSNFDQELEIKSVATEAPFVPVLDQTKDSRLGRVNIKKIRALEGKEMTDYTVLSHTPGRLVLKVKNIGRKNLMFKLLDRKNTKLDFDFEPHRDSIYMDYEGGPAKFLVLADGYRVVLPKVDSSNYVVPEEEIIYAEETPEEVEDSIEVPGPSGIEKFADKTNELFSRNTVSLKSWEIGAWGGGAVYGAGDIKPKFSIIDNFAYIPSTVDISMGLYAQYNFNSRFSVKASYYNSTISMHDLSAAGFFSGTAAPTAFNDEYELVELDHQSMDVRFLTNMNIVELEGLWHLRPYRVPDHRRSTLVPSVGVSVGALHYTPFRTPYSAKQDGENYFSYVSRVRPTRVNLRDLGTEGQNFLPGQEPYSTMAYSAGLSFSMTWLFRDFALKGEIRSVYTTTDYLDDFGPGLWYGGDRDAVVENHQLGEGADGLASDMLGRIDLPRTNTFRSTDGLNDWYFQGHLGFSIFLDKPDK